ncbi:class I SAM-dependent methyltransferase [Streptomyces sp. NBC_00038]|uniref:class I SAM-dependent methyltransferase n=1 Tax=Streptomyces sp. NBC_00038 TaxID=2903615 RepID=UPI00225802F0|nr:class I SAM-dependent methyltransferase [Streptomyces sp. NBC_00038]MCX5558829.1 class I SAM-dependent methyltransferase [Streptomyces sp. NBC_00038]
MADETGFQLSGSAPERYEQYAAPIMAPFVAAILDAADLSPGATVLDLACGTGFVARAAAARVGPAGRVSGADINEGMLRVAKAHAPRMYPDIEFTEASADGLPYQDATFDAVVCQQGVQFFPDLPAALAEVARVTRPGGRFVATAWADRNLIPYFVGQYEAVKKYVAPERVPEVAASYEAAFSGTPDRLTTTLREAGFHDVTVHEVTFGVSVPPLADYAAAQLSSVPWGQAIVDHGGHEALVQAGRAVHTHLKDRTAPDGSATLPFAANLVTGIR